MMTLGIETSCDETAAGLTDGRMVLAEAVSSSVHLHSDFGGVIPEIASRHHVEFINHVTCEVLSKAGADLSDVRLIAVTNRPGLIGALLVGISMAKALSLAYDIPLIAVDHLKAHLYAPMMGAGVIRFPFIGMVVSGGHTSLFLVRAVDDYKLIGHTLDDAAGEAFDKVAKLLGLGYPGGPAIEKRAQRGRVDSRLFPRTVLEDSFDFSFSGIKTAASRLTASEVEDIAASFQDAVTDILTHKAIAACRHFGIGRLVLGGGVTANKLFRKKLESASSRNRLKLSLPRMGLCLDNGVMVAGLGEALYKKGIRSDIKMTAYSTSVD